MRRLLLISVTLMAPMSFADSVAAQQTAPSTPQAPRTTPSPPLTNWSGPQVGVFGGGSVMPMNFVEPGAVFCPHGFIPQPPECVETPFGFSKAPIRPTFGVFAGYNTQYGNTVVGVAVDAAWKRGSISGSLASATVLAPPLGPFPGLTRNESFAGSMTQKWDGSVRLRYGTLLTPSTLAYATAGGAVGSVCGSFSYGATITVSGIGGSGAGSWCDARIGLTFGGGMETQLFAGSGPKIRFEYRYTSLGFGSFSKDVPLALTDLIDNCDDPVVFCGATAHINMHAAFHTFGMGFSF